METTKICIKCNATKDISQFTFRKDTQKYRNECKECMKKRADKISKKHYDKNKQIIKQNRLNNIEKFKKKDREYYLSNSDKIKAKRKDYVSKNKESVYSKNKEYREINKEELNKKAKEYYEQNKDRLLDYKKANYHDNIKKYRELNRISYVRYREKRKLNAKLYRTTEQGRLSEKNKNHKRRAIIKSGNVTTQQLKELYSTVKNCYWCNTKLNKKNTHLDHFIPLSRGGLHTIDNLVLSCSCCNLKKSNKDPFEFAQERGRLL